MRSLHMPNPEPYDVFLTFESVDEIPKWNESYLAVLSFGLICYAAQGCSILIFESVDEMPKCDYSNESYWAGFFYGAICISFFLTWKILRKSSYYDLEGKKKVNWNVRIARLGPMCHNGIFVLLGIRCYLSKPFTLYIV